MPSKVPAALPRRLLLIKANTIKHQAGFALYGSPPRWHKITPEKPAPKGAPVADHPEAAGAFEPKKIFTDTQWNLLKLPESNVNAPSYNKQLEKLRHLSETGNITAILASGFGTNTYGKKLAMVANHLLGLHGTQHTVTAGQKIGEHAAVKIPPVSESLPAAEPVAQEPVAQEPAPAKKLFFPVGQKIQFNSQYEKMNAGIWEIYNHAEDAYHMKKVGAKVPGPKNTVLIPAETLHAAIGNGTGKLIKKESEKAPAPVADPVPSAADNLAKIPWEGLKLPASNSNAKSHNGAIEKVKAMAMAGDVAGLKLFYGNKSSSAQTYNKKQAALALTALAALGVDVGKPAPAPATPAASKPTTPQGDKKRTPVGTVFEEGDAPPMVWVGGVWLPLTLGTVTSAISAMKDPAAAKTLVHKFLRKKKATYDGIDNFYFQNVLSDVVTALNAHDLDSVAKEIKQEFSPAPAAKVPKVIAAAMYHNTDDGSSKQWSVSVYGNKMTTQYGKIGKAVQTTVKEFSNGESAKLAASKLIDEKKKHGYYHVGGTTHEYADGGESPKAEMPGAATQDGPKDGDTKPGADGMLVFKDGHWHKMAEEKPKSPVADIAIPDFSNAPSGWEKHYTTVATLLKNKVLADGAAGFKGVVITHKPTIYMPEGSFSLNIGGIKIKHVSVNSTVPRKKAMAEFIIALKEAAGKAPKAAAKKPAQPKAAKAEPAYVAPTTGIESMDSWEQVGPQQGSNAGGKFKDQDGVEWYCKFPDDANMARAELLAAKLYSAAGLSAQDAKLILKNGKVGIASKWENLKKGSAAELSAADGARSGFAVDAWLANWDVVGLGYDNLQIGAGGKAHRVDAGGSLMYRAQGGKKAFTSHVGEIDSLMDAKTNPQTASVFAGMTTADITASVARVVGVSDNDIYSMVMEHGPGSTAEKAELADTLIARKADLLDKFPKAAKKAEKPKKDKPDPTALKVDASQLPDIHDFLNWKGPGQGLSSKDHVNKANRQAEQDLLRAALKGNLIALKDYHFEAVDKETGASQGMKPIEQHPSQHVKMYWSDLVSALSYIAYPPEALKRFASVIATNVKKVSEAFQPKSYGVTTNKADANSRLAFWIALGHAKPVETLVPAGGTLDFESSPSSSVKMTDKMRSAAKSAYNQLSSSRLVKRFINGIQSSGTYNDNFRDGKMITSDGHDAVGMVLDAYNYATEKPAGFEIYKWISFKGQMGQQLMAAAPGTVFQNPGSMCCSYEPTATSGFGHDRIRIRYAEGAKAVDSFGSGSYSSEKEITTLPGQRFVILSCKKVQCPVKHSQRIELDVLMLPPDESYVAELKAHKGKHGQSS